MLKLGTIDEFKSLVSEGKGFAKSNLYYVKFPTIAGINAYDLGLLCSSIDLPSRQMASTERQLGVTTQNVVYGYTNANINATFTVLNNQKVREYFESWQQFILPEYSDDEARFEVKYPDQYVATLHIYQLERGQSYPLFNKNFSKKLGPLNLNFDLDIDIGNSTIANYHWIIDRAFPISVTNTALSDADGELSTVSVEFAYKSWKGEKVSNGKQKASIFINR
jgi:hypothetical protein